MSVRVEIDQTCSEKWTEGNILHYLKRTQKNQNSPMETTVLAILPLPDFALRIKTESIDTFLPIPAIEYWS